MGVSINEQIGTCDSMLKDAATENKRFPQMIQRVADWVWAGFAERGQEAVGYVGWG